MPPRTKNPNLQLRKSPRKSLVEERPTAATPVNPVRQTPRRTSTRKKTVPSRGEGNRSGVGSSSTGIGNSPSEQVIEPIRPYGFVFAPDKYHEYPKISTRCNPSKAIEVINTLSADEKQWFKTHPQFKHIFHMEHHKNRMCMGIWMLALRIVDTGDRSQCWFVVNGVPIRYSLREHALLSGLHCHNYPGNLDEIGTLRFVNRYFEGKKPDLKQVLDKLVGMEEPGFGRLKMALLFFLGTVIKGKQKEVKGPIDDFLLRIVDDLELCKSFPWGRFTYDDCLHQMYKMVDKFKDSFAANHCLSGFILPLEVLAFECIEPLKVKFREDVERVAQDCPRLCKGKFKKSALKGFSLQELNDAVGESKEIRSTVVNEGLDEAHIAPHELYVSNPIVDGWNEILSRNGTIWWEDFYNVDVTARRNIPINQRASTEESPVQPSPRQSEQPTREHPPVEQPSFEARMKGMLDEFQKLVDKKIGDLSAQVEVVKKNIDDLSARVDMVEKHVFITTCPTNEGSYEVPENEPEFQADHPVEVESDATAEVEADVTTRDTPDVEADAHPVEVEADPTTTDAAEVEEDAHPVEEDAHPVEEDAHPTTPDAPVVDPLWAIVPYEPEPEPLTVQLPGQARQGRKRKPSQFCRTPYTGRTYRRKKQ